MKHRYFILAPIFFVFIFLCSFFIYRKYIKEYKKIAVLVTSYNNAQWYEKNLSSILSQKYPNFRLIYIDDASSDGTAQLVEKYIETYPKKIPTLLIKNDQHRTALANNYTAFHLIDDDEILVNVDGDDWLLHDQVLQHINDAYQDRNVWITFGYTIRNSVPEYHGFCHKIPEDILQENSYRDFHKDVSNYQIWAWWHPRSFYGWLAKQVKLEDLLINNSFIYLQAAPDSAFMYPIFEMAGDHYKSILKPAYLWNHNNPLSYTAQNKIKHIQTNRYIIAQDKYERLEKPLKSPQSIYKNHQADILLFAHSIENTKSSIDAITKNIRNFHRIYIVCADKNMCNSLQKLYGDVPFIKFNYKNYPLREHVLLLSDHFKPESRIDLSCCIQELERTFAFAFHCIADPIIKSHEQIGDNIIAWQYKNQLGKWGQRYQPDLTLYRLKDIQELLDHIDEKNSLDELFKNANQKQVRDKKIGLGYLPSYY